MVVGIYGSGVIQVSRPHQLGWFRHAAPWLGIVLPESGGQSVRALRIFCWFNGPWATIVAMVVAWVWGSDFPPLSRTYVLAGIACVAAVSRATLALQTRDTIPGFDRSWVRAAHAAGRRALGWALGAFLAVPWLDPHQVRLEWIVLLVPASFAGRALWEPGWWKASWALANWVDRLGHHS